MAKNSAHEPEFFGSATVGERGQIVIPAGARQTLGISPGDKLLIFSGLHGNGLSVMKSEQVSRFVSHAIERLTKIEELARADGQTDHGGAEPVRVDETPTNKEEEPGRGEDN